MSTRKQDPENSTFRQDSFSSSPEFERGVLANLVAARCQVLHDPETIAVLWWLQQVSWRVGGLDAFASVFLSSHQHLIGTGEMHRFGRAPGQIYSAEEVKEIRKAFQNGRYIFQLKDEQSLSEILAGQARRTWEKNDDHDDGLCVKGRHPTTYPVGDFLGQCEMSNDQFTAALKKLLLDPSLDPVRGLWNMPGLWSALSAVRARESQLAALRIVQTKVTNSVFEVLDFALEERAFVLIEGREGIGKTEAAVNWCERHPGKAVYLKIDSGTDDMTFFRGIVKQLGTPRASRKSNDIRTRIEDALQSGHLMLVIDESHFLWPQGTRSERSAPKRVDWLRTAIVDCKVPVALISTPQYFSTQCERFRRGSGWNANQIQRRLTRTLKLPDSLEATDVIAVAKRAFPAASKSTLLSISAVALGSVGYLTSIKHVRQQVDFFSRREDLPERLIIERVLADMGLVLSSEAGDQSDTQDALKTVLTPTSGTLNNSRRDFAPIESRSNNASLVVI